MHDKEDLSYTMLENEEFLVLSDCADEIDTNSDEYKESCYELINSIVTDSGIVDELLRKNIIEEIIAHGIDKLNEFEDDVAPRIFKKLRENLQYVISNDEKHENLIKFRLSEWLKLARQFGLKDEVTLEEFVAMDELSEHTWTRRQLSEIKESIDQPEVFSTKIFRIMFNLIKRKQCLDMFIKDLANTFRYSNTFTTSLRMIICFMLQNCDPELRQRLVNLLCLSNPVPLLNPSVFGKHIQYHLVPEIYWLFDDTSPMFLSFGIGECRGKSKFLNDLLQTNYEFHKDSIFFHGTVDVHFDKNFMTSTKRLVNVADAHGCLQLDIQEAILPIFHGFLIHVSCKHINSSSMQNILNILHKVSTYPNCQIVFLIIRDLKDEQEAEPFDSHNYDFLKINNKIHISSFPNLADPHALKFNYVDVFREFFYKQLEKTTFDGSIFKEEFKILLKQPEIEIIDDIETNCFELISTVRQNNYK